MAAVRDLRLGVIGHGRHASAKLHPAILLTGANINCVLTRSLSSACTAAESLGAQHYYDVIDNMLESESLDAVFICIDPEDQAALTIRCLQAGVAVFVEKPLGMTADEARQVHSASQKYNVPVMVGFMKRFAPAYQRLTDIIADRTQFGRILTIDASFAFAPWTPDVRADTFLQLGAIHMVDFLRATFGDVTVVTGYSNSSQSDIGLAYTLRFSDGSAASVTLSATQSREYTFEHITVTGTKGWVEADNLTSVNYRLMGQDGARLEQWDTHSDFAGICESDDPHKTEFSLGLCREGFYGEVDHFLNRIAENKLPSPSAAENVATMELCDEMIQRLES